ncbi:MAG TPA: ATP synthase F1 subunit epsilon [Tepidisphaeraceae bacterium]|nr:ATP synthase F1 subunit epsilon [Tepidisphaeraceae bacterium]
MSFKCTVVTPEQQVLDETVTQAILPAHDGQIGILTGHSPLLVKLGTGPLRIDLAGGQRRTYFVDGGVAQMKDDKLTILSTEAMAAADISAETARAELAEATAHQPTDDKARADRQRRMTRARVMQEIAGKA